MGLHVGYALKPIVQAGHYRWLETEVRRTDELKIVAGDFNLTPWSLQLQRFAWRTGLRRHGIWGRSWNAYYGGQRLLLIDNVFSSPAIRSVSFEIGPMLGSDHRPIIATVALP